MSGTATQPSELALFDFPLHGSRLIEASAGTGKTFTIAMLYVRLVLGHGAQTVGQGLMPPQILVMTFTEAATHELRERIRDRLSGAARCFLTDCEDDAVLLELRQTYPEDQWPACARRLQLAAEWMDEAAVSTIHAWCNRMLREHAFDSGSLFSQRLEPDQEELKAEAVRDFWRRFILPLSEKDARELNRWCDGPATLQHAVGPLLSFADSFEPGPEPAVVLGDCRAQRHEQLQRLKQDWPQWCDELQQVLDEARSAKRFNGTKLKQSDYTRWIRQLREWAEDAAMERPPFKADAAVWRRLTPQGLAEIWKDGSAPQHPALEAINDLPDALAELPDSREPLLRFAVPWIACRFAQMQHEQAQMGYNELLTGFDAALQGEGGERLAALVRRQFPAALIDEFQDTDPVQFRIVDAIYNVADNRDDCALVFIGDPKQAIYSFRGADIYTYLAARRATGQRHYTLATNFRSTEPMVAAVNTLFERAENRSGGAFLFGSEADRPLPFTPVHARGRKEVLHVDGVGIDPLTFWHLSSEAEKTLSKTVACERLSAGFAAEIAELVALGRANRACFVADDTRRGLQPADIAVLVNDGSEAAAVRTALMRHGVRSVYLSERDSVLQSACVREMHHWLWACAEPDNGRALRAALATPLLGLSWSALDALNEDELAWDDYVLQFRGYRDLWRTQGVLPMLRRLLHDFAVPARVLGTPEGERVLTDVLHLAEMLQHAATRLEGEHALLRHFAFLLGEAERADETRRLRLESDAALVQVVTVHKSKGLEYPLVFLPFAASCRRVTADKGPLFLHDQHGKRYPVLTAAPADVDAADHERLAEDVRKLYVALTRARHACRVGVAPIDDFSHSALGHVLFGHPLPAASELPQALQAQAGPAIAVAPLSETRHTRITAAPAPPTLGPARRVCHRPAEHWWIASYSALQVGGADAITEAIASAETAEEELFLEETSAAISAMEISPLPLRGMHAFPRGAAPGTFLHGLLEWAADFGFNRITAERELVADMVSRRCTAHGWQHWADTLTRWLCDYVQTSLPLPDGDAVALCELQRCQPELEFWFATHETDVVRLDETVRRYTLGGMARPAMSGGQLNGMLKGFIDLVFEHQGRYYVADYKSNWLGPDERAYDAEAMRAAVAGKRYDMQYAIYLFALHRLLRARLPDYDYERHVGGAVYGFLRGMRADSSGIHCERPPVQLIHALEEVFSGAETAV